jgi:3-oxoacyl-[acyl-carrier-protein] synthase II
VISGWAAVSPFGPVSADFTTGLGDGQRASGEASRHILGFDVREVLGRKGTRAMDRQTALAVAATGQLLAGQGGERIGGVGPESAMVLGTVTASAQSMMDFARDSLTEDKPYHVDPARFPNTVLNCAAARCAIWHQLKGPNTTVSAGRASGLLALNYARRLLRSGRAEVVLCGAVEELSPARSWLESDAGPLGEGCAMVLLEPLGRPGEHGRAELAEVLTLEFGFYGKPSDIRPALATCVRRALVAANETPDQVWAVASSGGPGPVGAGEAAALADVVGDRVPVRLHSTELVGDTNGASAAFALIALVGNAGRAAREAHGRTALVTSVDRDGVVGCALLRLGPAPTGTAD